MAYPPVVVKNGRQQALALGEALSFGIGFHADLNNTDQTNFTTNAVHVKVSVTHETLDIGNFYDAANGKWTPPAGLVLIAGQLVWVGGSLTSGDIVQARIYKNGSTLIIGEGVAITAPFIAAPLGTSVFTTLDQANGTDYYELYADWVSSTGGNRTVAGDPLGSYWSGVYLG